MTTKIKINVVTVVVWSSLVSLCCHVAGYPLFLVWVEKVIKTKSWSNSVPSHPSLVRGNCRLTNAVITWNNFSARPLNQDNAPVVIIVDIIFKRFTTIWNTGWRTPFHWTGDRLVQKGCNPWDITGSGHKRTANLSTTNWRFVPTAVLGPDYMSRAGPVSQAVTVCRHNFQPGITWGEPARLMADVMKRGRPDAMKRGRPCLILVRRRHEPLDML